MLDFLKALNDGAYNNIVVGTLFAVPAFIWGVGYALAGARTLWREAGPEEPERLVDEEQAGAPRLRKS